MARRFKKIRLRREREGGGILEGFGYEFEMEQVKREQNEIADRISSYEMIDEAIRQGIITSDNNHEYSDIYDFDNKKYEIYTGFAQLDPLSREEYAEESFGNRVTINVQEEDGSFRELSDEEVRDFANLAMDQIVENQQKLTENSLNIDMSIFGPSASPEKATAAAVRNATQNKGGGGIGNYQS